MLFFRADWYWWFVIFEQQTQKRVYLVLKQFVRKQKYNRTNIKIDQASNLIVGVCCSKYNFPQYYLQKAETRRKTFTVWLRFIGEQFSAKVSVKIVGWFEKIKFNFQLFEWEATFINYKWKKYYQLHSCHSRCNLLKHRTKTIDNK